MVANSLFSHCDRLEKVVLHEGITSLENLCFQRCWNLPELHLPASLTSIGDYAFVSCKGLSSIYIPAKVRHIGNKAFSNCQLLSTILVAEDNPFYATWEDCLYTKDLKTLLQVTEDIGKVKVHPATTTIKEWAASYGRLEVVELTEGLETIGKAAFFGSTIKEIRVPSTGTGMERRTPGSLRTFPTTASPGKSLPDSQARPTPATELRNETRSASRRLATSPLPHRTAHPG